jgi:hypothetical protein
VTRRLLVVFLLVGSVNLGMLGYVLAARSADGRRAREMMCRREPTLEKLVAAGEHYGLLARADVDAFRRTSPQDCPPSP